MAERTRRTGGTKTTRTTKPARVVAVDSQNSKVGNKGDIGQINISSRFALLNKLITRDLNNYRNTPKFYLYSKDDIQKYLSDPYRYEKELRRAVQYIYGASPHFRRVIQYFVGLSDLAYIIEPHKIDPKKINTRIINNNYRKTLRMLTSMNLKTQLPKILTICLREDTCFCTIWATQDDIAFQILPSEFCAITTVEGNVPNVTFDFSYFSSREDLLEFYPPEFKHKYESIYKKDTRAKWIDLDSPTSFAIKCNSDILEYAMPPFAGILREVYDIEDYKQLKSVKTALENYAMIVMDLPMDDDGNWGIDLEKARDFFNNLEAVLPEEIGSVLTPMKLDKISFEKSNTGDTNTVADAEQSLFTAAGVSSLLFNNDKASANALLLSIKADQQMTFGIVKQIGDAINRYMQSQSFGKNFRIEFLNVSCYNQKEAGDAYLKAASFGLPTISAYAASQGVGQAELDSMSFLETQVLGLQDMFRPIQSSTQMGSGSLESKAATDEGGAPTKEVGEITESGERNQEAE